jgi:hypothetical protein
MNNYRQNINQKLDSLEIKKELNTQYKEHSLMNNEQDISKAFKSRQAHVQQDSNGSIGTVDEADKYRATQMMAKNTATLAHRGSVNQSKFEMGEIQMREQIKEKASEGLSKIQSIVAINGYEGMIKRNAED